MALYTKEASEEVVADAVIDLDCGPSNQPQVSRRHCKSVICIAGK
jgi:hypothetical protein